MRAFIGWTPTVTGRLSFSRVGDSHAGDRTICNNTATEIGNGFLFGSQTRTSRDGPLPALIMRRLGRTPDTHYVVSLRVAEAQLPVTAPKAQADDPAKAPVNLERDHEGALGGEVIFFSRGRFLPKSVDAKIKALRTLARDGRAPSCDQAKRRQKRDVGEKLIAEIWDDLTSRFAKHEKLPGFGRVRVRLLRTGQCEILVEEADLYTSREVKAAQRLRVRGGTPDMQSTGFQAAAAAAARQSFFFIRELAHRHYHHDPHSDLLTTTYAWSLESDEHWRRETQYGLVRLAIAERRRDTAETFKRALGIIAYAEAFQKHLCGWTARFDAPPVRSSLAFGYDFASLRASIDASLKVRELKDGQRRQSFIFVFGFMVTCLGLVATGLRAGQSSPPTAAGFVRFLALLTAYPWQALGAAALLAFILDLSFLRVALRPPYLQGWTGGLGRAIEAMMGSLMWRHVGRGLAFLVGLLVLVLVTLGAGAVAYVAFSQLFQLTA